MSRPDSLDNIAEIWLEELEEGCQDYLGLILVGTKFDLWEEIGGVELDAIQEIADEIGATFMINTSARTGYGLTEDEKKKEGDKLLRRLDKNQDKAMSFEEFAEW